MGVYAKNKKIEVFVLNSNVAFFAYVSSIMNDPNSEIYHDVHEYLQAKTRTEHVSQALKQELQKKHVHTEDMKPLIEFISEEMVTSRIAVIPMGMRFNAKKNEEVQTYAVLPSALPADLLERHQEKEDEAEAKRLLKTISPETLMTAIRTPHIPLPRNLASNHGEDSDSESDMDVDEGRLDRFEDSLSNVAGTTADAQGQGSLLEHVVAYLRYKREEALRMKGSGKTPLRFRVMEKVPEDYPITKLDAVPEALRKALQEYEAKAKVATEIRDKFKAERAAVKEALEDKETAVKLQMQELGVKLLGPFPSMTNGRRRFHVIEHLTGKVRKPGPALKQPEYVAVLHTAIGAVARERGLNLARMPISAVLEDHSEAIIRRIKEACDTEKEVKLDKLVLRVASREDWERTNRIEDFDMEQSNLLRKQVAITTEATAATGTQKAKAASKKRKTPTLAEGLSDPAPSQHANVRQRVEP